MGRRTGDGLPRRCDGCEAIVRAQVAAYGAAPAPAPMKLCHACLEVLPLDSFARCGKGHRPKCRDCDPPRQLRALYVAGHLYDLILRHAEDAATTNSEAVAALILAGAEKLSPEDRELLRAEAERPVPPLRPCPPSTRLVRIIR